MAWCTLDYLHLTCEEVLGSGVVGALGGKNKLGGGEALGGGGYHPHQQQYRQFFYSITIVVKRLSTEKIIGELFSVNYRFRFRINDYPNYFSESCRFCSENEHQIHLHVLQIGNLHVKVTVAISET